MSNQERRVHRNIRKPAKFLRLVSKIKHMQVLNETWPGGEGGSVPYRHTKPIANGPWNPLSVTRSNSVLR